MVIARDGGDALVERASEMRLGFGGERMILAHYFNTIGETPRLLANTKVQLPCMYCQEL